MFKSNLIILMKKLSLLFLLIFPLLNFAQDTLTCKSGGRVYNSNQQKLTSEEIQSLLANNTEALHLYNVGKTKQTLGGILFYGGISTCIIKHISMINKHSGTNSVNANTNNVMYFIGGAMTVIAIPIKLGFSKKIERAISLINEDLKNPKTGFHIESTSFISNSNGIGISITF